LDGGGSLARTLKKKGTMPESAQTRDIGLFGPREIRGKEGGNGGTWKQNRERKGPGRKRGLKRNPPSGSGFDMKA